MGIDIINKSCKIAVFIAISLIFSGFSFAADPDIDSYYTDDVGQKTNTAKVGDTVQFYVEVYNGDQESKDNVLLEMDVKSALLYDDWSYYVTRDGGQTWKENDPSVDFDFNKVTWNIGTIGSGDLYGFNWIGVPIITGREEVYSTLKINDLIVGESSAFLVVSETNTTSKHYAGRSSGISVPMQETGVGLQFLGIAMTLLIGGIVIPKL
ncbi:MAG: hypothetical protein ACP5C3_01335 [Methanomicrobiales archaeon]